MTPESEKPPAPGQVARVVRTLRRERAWTQTELARRLGLSQSRLSEIENGDGCFTAEQFLIILKLFNVPLSRFAGDAEDQGQQLKNALVRLGAHHLRESATVVPREGHDDVATVVREALLDLDPRTLTALAPVLATQVDRVSLGKVHLDLAKLGVERRLTWLCENTVAALRIELAEDVPRAWAQKARRAIVVLGGYIESAARGLDGAAAQSALPPDLVDRTVRSKRSLEEVNAVASSISRRWGIVSALQPEDFARALEEARAAHY